MEHLSLAKKHAQLFDIRAEGEQEYTSLFLRMATDNKQNSAKNYTSPDEELVYEMLKEGCFDFIRNDPDFLSFANTF